MILRTAARAIGAMMIFGLAAPAVADPVAQAYIRAAGRGAETDGDGYLVARGPECFLVAPRHVIATEIASDKGGKTWHLRKGITVTDSSSTPADGEPEVVVIFQEPEEDLAVLKLHVSPSFKCGSETPAGDGIDRVLGGAIQSGDSGFRIVNLKGGQTTAKPSLALTGLDDAHFSLNTATMGGTSGSVVYHGDMLVGMVVTSAANSGKGDTRVLRQDFIYPRIKPFVKSAGVTVLLKPFLQNGKSGGFDSVVSGTADMRQVLEGMKGINVKEAPPSDYDKDYNLHDPMGADYVLGAQIIVGNVNTLKAVKAPFSFKTPSLPGGKLLEGVLGGNNSTVNVGGKDQRKQLTLRMLVTLQNVKTGQTYTRTFDHTQEFPDDAVLQQVVEQSLERELQKDLPEVMTMAGLT